MTDSERLEVLIQEFETEHGELPRVTPAIELYERYKTWAKARGGKGLPIDRFILIFARESVCLPCRLPDGSIGFIGVKPLDGCR